LVVGDVEGRLAKVYDQVEKFQKKGQHFDFILSVGAFFPEAGFADAPTQFAPYVTGKEKAAVETYFIESRSAALLQSSAAGKQLCENVHFLGGYGIREIHGLQVAYLSGRYDASVYGESSSSVATPDFIGSSYTSRAVDALKQLAKEPGRPPIDVLLTADWPANVEKKMLPVEMPKDPDGAPINWAEKTAPPIAELCSALEPRYHIFGTNNIFYQRPPFQTAESGRVCRCIGVGKVGSKGKGRQWVHALQLTAASEMADVALKQRPENTTPCPFVVAGAAPVGEVTELEGAIPDPNKRSAEETEPVEEIVPNQVFLGGLPFKINEKRLMSAFQNCGKIEEFKLARNEEKECKGFGWITFETAEAAQAAIELNDMLEVNGRKISIRISKKKEGSGPGAGKKQKVEIKIEPHADCWFCLVNPKVEKHMIITATTDVYVAGARGPINPQHVLILPVKHAPCYAACPAELQDALAAHIAAIRKMCQASGQECIVWERWVPMGISAANHMQIQVVPIDKRAGEGARDSLQIVAKKRLDGGMFRKVSSHREVRDHVKDDSGIPYVYFEIPGENSAKGRLIERYVYAGVPGGPRVPMNIGREVACHLLECGDKDNWKDCQEEKAMEKQHAVAFRERFKQYQPR